MMIMDIDGSILVGLEADSPAHRRVDMTRLEQDAIPRRRQRRLGCYILPDCIMKLQITNIKTQMDNSTNLLL